MRGFAAWAKIVTGRLVDPHAVPDKHAAEVPVVHDLPVFLMVLVIGADGALGFAAMVSPVSGLAARDIPAHSRVGLAAIPMLSGTRIHSK